MVTSTYRVSLVEEFDRFWYVHLILPEVVEWSFHKHTLLLVLLDQLVPKRMLCSVCECECSVCIWCIYVPKKHSVYIVHLNTHVLHASIHCTYIYTFTCTTCEHKLYMYM